MINTDFYHEPVLREEVLKLLVTTSSGVYVDCTLGGGGHFRMIAEKLDSNATLIGIDRDPDSIRWNQTHKTHGPGSIIEQCRFSRFDSVLAKYRINAVDGILLDLGVSSFQIENPYRGFSYMKDSALDMRMNTDEGISASELLKTESQSAVAEILERFGEVQNAPRMAKAIKDCPFPLETSADLRECLKREYGPNLKIKVLAKVFQALRIAVNDELGELKLFLNKVCKYLLPNGRVVIIAYHSLEDRMVKEFMRSSEQECVCPAGQVVCTCHRHILLKRINKKAIKASENEIKKNPRARSARLRAAQRTQEVLNEEKS